MGVDVIGNKPSAEEGEYFRNNWWWWRPLASYVCEIGPEITAHCKYWHSNDHDGLDAEHACALAERLEAEIASGRCERYERRHKSEQEMAPNEPCDLCDGTGTRKPVPERGAGDTVTGVVCNGCGGEGVVRPFWTHYPFDVDNVQRFVRFLRTSGGFIIG
jgi:hypothetical protein